MPGLRVVASPDASLVGPWRAVPMGTTVLGRAPDVPFRILDERVSRKHAELRRDDRNRLTVMDASANGIYVNRARISAETTLNDGDVFRIGDTIAIVRLRDPDEAREPPLPGCIGDSPPACAMYGLVRKVARSGAITLVIGESGTGKELVASAIHQLGHAGTPFVPVNCAAIAENLAESALFGHVAGAFTGAAKPHLGYFRAADGGVLFLDEVGELAAPLQAKLLRALEEHAVTPVGAENPIACRPRIVAATNKDLHAAVFTGGFRGDLYARLAEVVMVMPTLRDRREDILPILRDALGASPILSADLCEALLVYPWPFNVRELRKLAVDLRVRGEGLPSLELDLVADRLRMPEPTAAAALSPRESATPQRDAPPDRDALVQLLRDHHGSIADIARATGRSRKQVYRWLEVHDLDAKTFRS